MRCLTLYIVFVSVLTADHQKQIIRPPEETTKPEIKTEAFEQQGIYSMFTDISESVADAFEKGTHAEGRTGLLVAFLKNRNSTKLYQWVVSDNPEGFSHTSTTYIYYKIEYKSMTHFVKIVGFLANNGSGNDYNKKVPPKQHITPHYSTTY